MKSDDASPFTSSYSRSHVVELAVLGREDRTLEGRARWMRSQNTPAEGACTRCATRRRPSPGVCVIALDGFAGMRSSTAVDSVRPHAMDFSAKSTVPKRASSLASQSADKRRVNKTEGGPAALYRVLRRESRNAFAVPFWSSHSMPAPDAYKHLPRRVCHDQPTSKVWKVLDAAWHTGLEVLTKT